MTVETAVVISDLNALNPGSTDPKAEGDDHLRLLKTTIKATFPNITGPVTATHTLLNNAAAGNFGAQAVTGTSFNGKLVTSNVSQWTNDAGYITGTSGAAGALTGTMLAANVVNSSLTSVGVLSSLSVSGAGTLSNVAVSAFEGLRLANSAGYLAGFNTANLVRTGYMQFNAGGLVQLVAEAPATNGLSIGTTGGYLTLAQTGAATFSGAVTGTSFNGKLATANVSQFTNDSGYITGVTSGAITGALGFTPYNATNPAGYISGVTSGAVTGALGFTPYNATNPAGYINGAGNAATATNVAWGGVTGKPINTITMTTTTGTPAAAGVFGDEVFVY